MGQPFISIIVPVFNGERTLAACLESLVSQRYPRSQYEILVVDNNSRDRTASIIRSYGATYLRETTRQSSYAARNTGLRHATGEMIAFTDADCVADADWLANAVGCFGDAGVGGVAGKVGNASPVTTVQEYLQDALAQEGALGHPYLPYAQTANVLYRHEVLKRVGVFESGWTSGGDADMAWRMQRTTGYRLVYCESAIVLHQHRMTRHALFQQRRMWGRGEVLLYRRYREAYLSHELVYGVQECLRNYGHLMRLMGQAAVAWGRTRVNKVNQKRYEFALCDCLGELGNRIGRIEGSVLNRVWYL